MANRPWRRPKHLDLSIVESLERRRLLSSLIVTNTNDSGPGSLRQALLDSNASISDDTITFDTSGTFATPQTIAVKTSFPPLDLDLKGGSLTIIGPGPSNLAIVPDPQASALAYFNSGAPFLNLSGFRISGGNSVEGVAVRAGMANLDNMVFTENHASGDGGAIRLSTGGLITNSVFSGNSGSRGGAIALPFGGALVIENCTISGNTATSTFYGGGGVFFSGHANPQAPPGFLPSTVLIRSSSIFNNLSAGPGGGIAANGFSNNTLLIQNSTLVGNTTANTGGAVSLTSGSITVQNSTITANVSNGSGNSAGGISNFVISPPGSINVNNSIVSGNVSANAPDIGVASGVTTNINYSAIGSAKGFTLSPISGNNLPFGTNLLLGSLADNGGRTQTILPQPASPLIDAGSNALVPPELAADQRGNGFQRIFNSTVDIGATEYQPKLAATANTPDVTSDGATNYTFTITFADDHDIDVSSIIGNNDAVRINDGGSFDVPVIFVSVDDPSNGTVRSATYSFSPPGGSWDRTDNNTYHLIIQPNQVRDLDGNFALPGETSSFMVAIDLLVTNTNDDGPGSLRQAIVDAHATPNADIIEFDSAGRFATAQTIGLLTPLPQFSATSGPLTIKGPGSALLTIRPDPSLAETVHLRLLDSAAPVLTVSGITFTNANSLQDGGTLITSGATRTVLDDVVIENSRAVRGGAIYLGDMGLLTVRNSTISGNFAQNGGGAVYSFNSPVTVYKSTISGNTTNSKGGGFYLQNPLASLVLENSLVSRNTAVDAGGGIAFYPGGTLFVDNSTISDNSSNGGIFGGGGIFFYGSQGTNPPGAMTVRESTISNNKAKQSGGGILVANFGGGVVQLLNTTIAGNSSSEGGGITLSSGGVLIQSSTIVGNSSNSLPGLGGGVRCGTCSGTITIINSAIAGNTDTTGNSDISSSSSGGVSINYSAIGSNQGFTPLSSSGNNLPYGTNLLLGPLTNNGGLTQTMLPQPGSPLIGAGSNSLIPSGTPTDQRGPGFSRISGPSVDIGAVEVDVVLPAVQSSLFNYTTGRQSLRYTFSEPVTLDKSALELHNVSNGAIIPVDKIALSYDSAANTATFTFPGYPNGVLPDGDYRAFLLKDGVQDPSHNHPAIDHMAIFGFLLGDLNGDRTVSIADFITLASNFGKTGVSYDAGDTNYDGTVSIADFIDLAAAFGNSLGPPPPTTAPQPAAEVSIRSDTLFSPTRCPHRRHPMRHHPRPRLLFKWSPQ